MARFLLALSLALHLALGAGSLHADDEQTWRLVKERNDIRVYMRHTDNSKIKTFRGISRYIVDNPMAFSGVLNDYAYMPTWLHFVSGATEIGRRSYFDRDLRFTTRLPWPLADREALVNADVRQDPATHDVAITLSNRPDLIPPDDDYIRFPEFYGRFDFAWVDSTPDNRYVIEVTYEIIIDPGGAIPPWLANIILTDTPYYTLRRLHGVIEDTGRYDDYNDDSGLRFPPANEFNRERAANTRAISQGQRKE